MFNGFMYKHAVGFNIFITNVDSQKTLHKNGSQKCDQFVQHSVGGGVVVVNDVVARSSRQLTL